MSDTAAVKAIWGEMASLSELAARQAIKRDYPKAMRLLFLAMALLATSTLPVSAENLTPERCRQIADGIAPLLPQFDGLERAVKTVDTSGVVKASKGRLQEAAEEVGSTQKEFLRAASVYQGALAFLFNEMRNCQYGVSLPRGEE